MSDLQVGLVIASLMTAVVMVLVTLAYATIDHSRARRIARRNARRARR